MPADVTKLFDEDARRRWEGLLIEELRRTGFDEDPAHDLAHFHRVVATAKRLCEQERACWEVVVPAAWLHDLVNVPKNDPRRAQASRLSAEAARRFLVEHAYPAEHLDGIAHAIEAHSYSAQVVCRTVEASVVQDADRLDGLGAIGVARVFAVSGLMRRKLYCVEDPFGEAIDLRTPPGLDDVAHALDHFYVKLFRTVDSLRTAAGRAEGQRRAAFMRDYLDELRLELGS